jgi:hypothetical protein
VCEHRAEVRDDRAGLEFGIRLIVLAAAIEGLAAALTRYYRW